MPRTTSSTVDRDGQLLVYGATGYSGRLVVEALRAAGVRPVLGGRDERKLAALGDGLGLPYRVTRLDDGCRLDAALAGVRVVLHAAGPFSRTAAPMVDACLRTGVHYLDLTGEVLVIEAIARRHRQARTRGVMLMPAVGFDVVATDCLAAHVARALPGALRLALAVSGLALMTRGSARTLAEAAGAGVVRRGGGLTPARLGSLRRTFDYGAGPRASVNVSWGDVASAYYTTGIPDVEVYAESTPMLEAALAVNGAAGPLLRTVPWQLWLRASAEMLPEGPTASERGARRMAVVAEADDGHGRRVSARLRTPEAFTFTGTSAAAIARRALAGDVEPGFQTPGRVYGPDFVLGLPGVTREDAA